MVIIKAKKISQIPLPILAKHRAASDGTVHGLFVTIETVLMNFQWCAIGKDPKTTFTSLLFSTLVSTCFNCNFEWLRQEAPMSRTVNAALFAIRFLFAGGVSQQSEVHDQWILKQKQSS